MKHRIAVLLSLLSVAPIIAQQNEPVDITTVRKAIGFLRESEAFNKEGKFVKGEMATAEAKRLLDSVLPVNGQIKSTAACKFVRKHANMYQDFIELSCYPPIASNESPFPTGLRFVIDTWDTPKPPLAQFQDLQDGQMFEGTLRIRKYVGDGYTIQGFLIEGHCQLLSVVASPAGTVTPKQEDVIDADAVISRLEKGENVPTQDILRALKQLRGH